MKKQIALLLSLTMALTSFAFPVWAEGDAETGTEVEEVVVATPLNVVEDFADAEHIFSKPVRATFAFQDSDSVLNSSVGKIDVGCATTEFCLGSLYYDTGAPKTGVIETGMKVWIEDTSGDVVSPIGVTTSASTANRIQITQYAPTVYVTNEKLYEKGSSDPIKDADGNDVVINSQTWYDFKVTMNIDGDATTIDTYDYVIKLLDGTEVASGKGKSLNLAYAGNSSGAINLMKENEGIQYFTFGNLHVKSWSGGQKDPGYVLADDIYIKHVAPVATVEGIEDEAKEVDFNKTEITINFNQYMDTATYGEITVTDGENTVVSGTPTTTSKKSTTIPVDLDPDTSYTLTIPAISADCGYVTDEQTITFTTKQEYDESLKTFMDFENAKGVTGFPATAYAPLSKVGNYDGGLCGFITDETLNSTVVKLSRYLNTQTSSAQLFLDTTVGKKGRIEAGIRINTDDVTNSVIVPIGLGNGSSIYNSNKLTPTIKITNGSFYAGTTAVAPAEANVWYDVKVFFNIDGTEENDTFDYVITKVLDGSLVASGANVQYGNGATHGSSEYGTATSVQYFAFAGISPSVTNGTVATGGIMVDNIYLDYAKPEANVVELAGDLSAVKATDSFTVDFGQYVDMTKYNTITLVNNTKNEPVELTVSEDSTRTKAILTFDQLDYESNYTLTVPDSIKAEYGLKCPETEIKFTTEEYYDAEFAMTENFEDGSYTDTMKHYGSVEASGANGINCVPNEQLGGTAAQINRHYAWGKTMVGGMVYDAGSIKSGVIETGVKVLVDDVTTTRVYPIDLIPATDVKAYYHQYQTVYIRGGNFYEGRNETPIAVAESDVWYDIKVTLDEAGVANTDDTFDYTISAYKDGEWKEIASGTDVKYGTNGSFNAIKEAEGIQYFAFGVNGTTNTIASDPNNSFVVIDDVYVNYANPVATVAEFANGTENVAPTDTLTVNFNQYMDTTKYADITLVDEDGDEIDVTVSEKSTKKAAILTFAKLDYESTYTLTLPESLRAEWGKHCAEQVIPFTTKQFYDDTFAMSANFDNSTLGALVKGSDRLGTPTFAYDETLGSIVGTVTRGSMGERSVTFLDYPVTEGKKGMIETGIKFKTEDAINTFSPISLGSTHAWSSATGAQHATVYIFNNYFYAGGSKIVYNEENVLAEANQWYDVKVVYDIDGEASTPNTFDYELYKITADGNVLIAKGTDCALTKRLISGTTTLYSDAATISDFAFLAYGMCYAEGISTTTTGAISFDDAYIKYVDPVATIAEFANGTTKLAPMNSLTVNFSQYMKPETYAGIKLYKGETEIPVVASTTSKTSTVLTFDTLAYDSSYRLVIPATVKAEYGFSCEAEEITFTTKENYDDTLDMFVNLENGSISPLVKTGRNNTPVIPEEKDPILNSKVATVTRNVIGEVGTYASLQYKTTEGKYGMIETGIKFKTTDIQNYMLPIVINTDQSFANQYATVYICDGIIGVGGKKIADAKADTWYDLKVIYDIDGVEGTPNTFGYELYEITATNEKTLLGSGSGFAISNRMAQYPDTVYSDIATIKDFAFLAYGKGYNGGAHDADGIITFDDAYIKYVEPKVVNSTIADGTQAEPVEVYEIEFNQYMNVETYKNITVDKVNMTTSEYEPFTAFTVSGTSKKAVLTFDDRMDDETVYRIIVPASVKAMNGKGVERKEINFFTDKYQYIDTSLSFERNFDDDSMSGLNFQYAGQEIVTDSVKGKVLRVKKSGSPSTPHTSYVSSAYYTPSTPQTGSIFMSVKFKVTDTETWDFSPISIFSPGNVQSYYSSTALLRVKNGKFLENDCETSPADAKANTWYQLDVTLFVDGDKTTVDRYKYTLKALEGELAEGITEITRENIPLSKHEYGGSGRGEQVSVSSIHFGVVSTYGKGYTADDERGSVTGDNFIDDIVIKKFVSPVVTASIVDGAENVALDQAITFTFDQKVNAADFANITLTKNGEAVAIRPTLLEGYTKECTVQLAEGILDYSSDYVLTIKNVKNDGGYSIVTQVINFRTAARGSDIAISNKVVSNTTFAAGEVITVSADFTNKSQVTGNPAALFIALYNGDDMYAVGYTTVELDVNETEGVSASLTVPEGFNAEGASVRVFAWDSIDGMNPVSID